MFTAKEYKVTYMATLPNKTKCLLNILMILIASSKLILFTLYLGTDRTYSCTRNVADIGTVMLDLTRRKFRAKVHFEIV